MALAGRSAADLRTQACYVKAVRGRPALRKAGAKQTQVLKNLCTECFWSAMRPRVAFALLTPALRLPVAREINDLARLAQVLQELHDSLLVGRQNQIRLNVSQRFQHEFSQMHPRVREF